MPVLIRNIMLIAFMTSLTCIGAFIRIPFVPVPITLQTLFVYLSGIILGRWMGLFSQILYLLIGFAGFPVFASGSGAMVLVQPSLGYLLGFPVAAWVIGSISSKKYTQSLHFKRAFFCILPGLIIVLSTGFLGLIINTHWITGKPLDLIHLLWVGFLVFLPGEMIKIILACRMAVKMYPFTRQLAL
jgi:biotin transport system substrate-specific component